MRIAIPVVIGIVLPLALAGGVAMLNYVGRPPYANKFHLIPKSGMLPDWESSPFRYSSGYGESAFIDTRLNHVLVVDGMMSSVEDMLVASWTRSSDRGISLHVNGAVVALEAPEDCVVWMKPDGEVYWRVQLPPGEAARLRDAMSARPVDICEFVGQVEGKKEVNGG